MADLIIKNMEMRSACSGETDCFALDEYGDYPMCRITGETRGYTFPIKERCMDNCPLRPAPEWISVEERLPEAAGNYIVAYHPCYWDDVKYQVTNVGIDAFRGKTTWAKNKHQRVTHWMPLPEVPE